MKKIQEKGDFMLLAVNIVIGFGILLNLSIYAYQKGSEQENVDTNMDSDDLDTRVGRNNVNSRKI
ncbi:hypothetical protein [Listeria seeligeri]|uniref:hypothetical protein n=1 Tax=Listeria seeligeri TaxID=1640 RepID=UPI001942271A|nr:hypothetical protein [Listeria seeligeri]